VELTDTHCHLDINKFDSDREAVISRALEAGLTHILIPGLTVSSSETAVNLAEKHSSIFAAAGIHPNEALTWEDITSDSLCKMAANKKVIAIGEIGLDYYWNHAPYHIQQEVFKKQLHLAAELNLPVIIHMREAKDAIQEKCAEDLVIILEDWVAGLRSKKNPLQEHPGVLHSFSGSHQTALKAIELGFFIGVTGSVTFQNAVKRQKIVGALPCNRLLIETDAPFLAPHPHRGKRNEPAYVRLVVEKIAQLHGQNVATVAKITTDNAARLFFW
jgi:TatD DNase family protein